jgi:hypothetical protein
MLKNCKVFRFDPIAKLFLLLLIILPFFIEAEVLRHPFDVNAAMDRMSAYSNSIARSYWEVLPNMPYTASGPYAGYSLDSLDNAYIHVFGGSPGPLNDHYIWDQEARTWSTGTPLPQGAAFGGHCSINNKIYMIGSLTSGTDSLMTVYDAESDVYSTVTLPHPIGDPAVAVKDSNYIYIIGGCLTSGWIASTSVMLFDVVGDSFISTVNQLPSSDARTCAAAGYIEDTIVVAGGINYVGIATNVTLMGYVDPANPANITWTHGPYKPGDAVYRLNGGVWNNIFYIAGGSTGGIHSLETLAYISGTGWVILPVYPLAITGWGCAMAPVDTNDTEFLAEGMMYACGNYSSFNVLHTGDIISVYVAEHGNDAPSAFSCGLMSMNPIVGRVSIQFSMPDSGPVRLIICDVTGRTVRSECFGNISCGTHTLIWNCEDNNGIQISAGIYFYRLEAAGNIATGKLIVVR